MQVHSKHRPFGCLHCSKCFKRRSALTRHMRTIHEMASSAPSSLSCSTVPSTGGLNATAPAVEKQTIVSEPNPLTLNMAPYSTSPHVSPSNNLLLTPGPMVPGFMMPSRDQPNPFVGAEPPMYSYALPWQSPYVWTVVSPVIPQPLSQPTKLPLPVMSPLNQGMFWPQILPQAPTANSISWFAQTIPSTTS